MAGKLTVVIIGASHAGCPTAHQLLKGLPNVKVILINPSQQFYWNIAAPRVLASPKAFTPDKYLFNVADQFRQYPAASFEFVLGSARHIDPSLKSVTVEGKSTRVIQYDYLVIASGSTTQATVGQDSSMLPFKPTDGDNLQTSIEKSQDELSKARTIVVAGGGPVGVEFAGELADTWGQRKSITLISASKRLLPILKNSAGEAAQRMLREKGVKVITSRSVQRAERQHDGWVISLDNGDTLTADLYVPSTGVLPNSGFIPPQFLDNDGWVNVNSELRVTGSGGDKNQPIYAIGDITSHSPRLATRLPAQISAVVANIKADVQGKGKRVQYDPEGKPPMMMMIVPVGAKQGTGQLGGWVVWSFMVAKIKGKDFFLSQAKASISAK